MNLISVLHGVSYKMVSVVMYRRGLVLTVFPSHASETAGQ